MFGLVQELSRCDHIGSRGHHELFEPMQMNRLLWEFCGNRPCSSLLSRDKRNGRPASSVS